MTESHRLIRNFKKILQLEKAKGYQDQAVFGGLQTFIEDFSEKIRFSPSIDCSTSLISDMKDLAASYSHQTISERRKAISELEDIQKALMVKKEEKSEAAVAKSHLDKPIRYAKGVGKEETIYLKKLGIKTIRDLLFYFPYRIENRRGVKKIADLKDGEEVTVKGYVQFVDTIRPKEDLQIVKIAVSDGSGTAYGIWFNQPGVKSQFSKGEKVAIYGKIEKDIGGVQIKNPVSEPIDQKLHTQRLVPIYRTTEGLSTLFLRKLIWDNLRLYLGSVEEILPRDLRESRDYLTRKKAIKGLHFPESISDQKRSRSTLAHEELFIFQLGVLQERKRRLEIRSGKKLKVEGQVIKDFLSTYPFKLTHLQKKVIEEITEGMASPKPMRRLLQGDVGSGKTLVATLGCFIYCKAGYQAAFMAPTEMLAEQHYLNLKERLSEFNVEIFKKSQTQSEKEAIKQRVGSREVDILVGTHSLGQDGVVFDRLGLVVIDEQSDPASLGRWKLGKIDENVDILVMSETPIAETLRLTLYGQYDFSTIDRLPITRKVETYWVSEGRRDQVYEFVLTKLKQGQQAYVIYPPIKESDGLDLTTAVQGRKDLAGGLFKDFRVRLLSLQMPDLCKKEVISMFRSGDIDVLVSTMPIDIEIDIPTISLMVIEHADRFSLTQLHWLRGRIGWSGQKSYCFGLATPAAEEVKARLEAFRDITDGFEIAEIDLKIRGPGELLGLISRGMGNTFKAVDLTKDLDLMKAARREAKDFLAGNNRKESYQRLMKEFAKRREEEFKSLTT